MNVKKNAGYEREEEEERWAGYCEEEEVKLEFLKLEFHMENTWIFFHISSHNIQIET